MTQNDADAHDTDLAKLPATSMLVGLLHELPLNVSTSGGEPSTCPAPTQNEVVVHDTRVTGPPGSPGGAVAILHSAASALDPPKNVRMTPAASTARPARRAVSRPPITPAATRAARAPIPPRGIRLSIPFLFPRGTKGNPPGEVRTALVAGQHNRKGDGRCRLGDPMSGPGRSRPRIHPTLRN
jgi:hypothetical protein